MIKKKAASRTRLHPMRKRIRDATLWQNDGSGGSCQPTMWKKEVRRLSGGQEINLDISYNA